MKKLESGFLTFEFDEPDYTQFDEVVKDETKKRL